MRSSSIAIAILCAAGVAQEPQKILPALDGGVIQRAINDAVPGKTVTIQRGRYTLTRPLQFRAGVKLKGVNRDDVVVSIEARLGPAMIVKECQQGSIENMTFESTKVQTRGEHPLLLTLDSTIDIRNCVVRNAALDGIWTRGRGRVLVENCTIEGSHRHGVYATGKDNLIVVRGCKLIKNGDRLARKGREGAGVQFNDRAKGTVEKCTCTENTWGIRVTNYFTRGSVKKNSCAKNLTGIKFEKGADGECFDNVCTKNDRYGIHLTKREGKEPKLRGNRLAGNGHGGLKKN